jgi:signal transduction histidine kinase
MWGRVFFFIVLSISSSYLCLAQDKRIADSLETVLAGTGQDTTRVHVLNKLGKLYRSTDGKRARGYLETARTLATQLGFDRGLAETYNVLSMVCDYEGNYPDALKYSRAAITTAQRVGDRTKEAKLWDNLGGLFLRMSEYDSAFAALSKSLQIKEKAGDKKALALTYDQIGSVHSIMGNYASALRYHLKGLSLKESLPDNADITGTSYIYIAIVHNQLGNYNEALTYFTKALEAKKGLANTEDRLAIYLNRANVYMYMERWDEAIADNGEALRILGTGSNIAAKTSCYNSLACIYKMMHQDNSAMAYYKLALPLAEQMDDRYLQSGINNSLGEIAGRQRKFGEALGYLKKGHDLAAAAGVLEYLKENYLAYADVYTLMNDHKKALEHYKLYVTIKDSILNEDKNKQIAEMNARYETERKEKQIVVLKSKEQRQQLLLQKRKNQLITLGAVAGICALVAGFLINRRNLKQKAALIVAQADAQLMQVKTRLDTEQAERKRIAKDLHDELGSGISRIVLCNELAKKHINGNESLNHTLHNIDHTVTELAGNMNSLIWALQVEHATVDYLFAKMREFASEFFEDSSIEPQLHIENVTEVIPMSEALVKDLFLVYKEALNNAMKYSQASRITIDAGIKDKAISIRIHDNGIGKDTDTTRKSGNGLRNMQARVAKHNGNITIDGHSDGTIIEVQVRLPATG